MSELNTIKRIKEVMVLKVAVGCVRHMPFGREPQMPTFWPLTCRTVAAAWVVVGLQSGEILALEMVILYRLNLTITTPELFFQILRIMGCSFKGALGLFYRWNSTC
jgi:hypothetical protein